MPRKLTLIFSSLFVLGFVSAWSVSYFLNPKSALPGKNQQLSFIRIEKHLTPVLVSIQGPEVFPDNEDEPVLVRGVIRTPYPDFAQLQYQWTLPEDVDLLKGHVSGEIQNPVVNQSYEIELLVKGFNSLQRKELTLFVSTYDKAGMKIGNSSIITSRPEDSLEHLAPVVMAEAQELKASQERDRVPASGNEK